MDLTKTAGGCVLNKGEIKKVVEKLKETEENLLWRAISQKDSALLTFYSKLREKLTGLNEMTPAEFIAIATDVIDVLRSDAMKINITYAHKYDGLKRLIPMIAVGVFPLNFYEEVQRLFAGVE